MLIGAREVSSFERCLSYTVTNVDNFYCNNIIIIIVIICVLTLNPVHNAAYLSFLVPPQANPFMLSCLQSLISEKPAAGSMKWG